MECGVRRERNGGDHCRDVDSVHWVGPTIAAVVGNTLSSGTRSRSTKWQSQSRTYSDRMAHRPSVESRWEISGDPCKYSWSTLPRGRQRRAYLWLQETLLSLSGVPMGACSPVRPPATQSHFGKTLRTLSISRSVRKPKSLRLLCRLPELPG